MKSEELSPILVIFQREGCGFRWDLFDRFVMQAVFGLDRCPSDVTIVVKRFHDGAVLINLYDWLHDQFNGIKTFVREYMPYIYFIPLDPTS